MDQLPRSDWPVTLSVGYCSDPLVVGPAHCGCCHLWAGGSGLHKKAGPRQEKGVSQEALVSNGFCFNPA